MNERNFSEDILSIFYAAFLLSSIWQADKQKQSLIPSKEKAEEWKEEKTSASFHQESLFSQDEMEQKFADLYQLTKRERDIMHLLLRDKTNQEISELLYIATGTVKCHIHNIYEKMDITKRSQLFSLYYTQIYKMIYKNRILFLKFRIEEEDCLPDSPFSVFMLRIRPLHP